MDTRYTTAYSEKLTDRQPVALDKIATELCPSGEIWDLLNAAPEPSRVEAARWMVIERYESGEITAQDAFKEMDKYGCLDNPDEVMRALCFGYEIIRRMSEPDPDPAGNAMLPDEDFIATMARVREERVA